MGSSACAGALPARGRMGKLLEQVFHVRPDERRIVLLFFAFFCGVGMFYTVSATVGDTLFLAHLGASEVPRMLPLVYLGIAAANVVSTLAFDAVQARVARTHSIVGTQLVLGASVLLARQLIEARVGYVYLGLVIWLEACSLISITLFYSFAGDYFSARDARRLYGFIAGGMSLGTVVSGSAIEIFVGALGTKNLLYAGGSLLVLDAALAFVIYRTGTPVTTEAVYAENAGDELSLGAIFARPYVRLLSAMIPLAIVTYVIADYQMKWIASAKSEEELARFFGSFYGWVGVAQILFQFLLAQRVLQRLGVISSLMILPLLIGVASALLYGTSFLGDLGPRLLLLSAGVNFLRMTLSETLDLPSRELLLLPLPTRLRRRVQPLLSGALAPGAQGVAAVLLLLALRLQLRVQTLSLIALVSSALLVVTLSRLRPRYRQTLAATLRDHQLDATDLEALLRDPTAESLIATLLRSDDTEVAKATIDLLDQRDLGSLAKVLEELVDSTDAELAIAALRRLADDPRCDSRKAIARAQRSVHPALRQAAVLALCKTRGEAAMREVEDVLKSADQGLRNAAIIGLARHGGATGRALVLPELRARAASAEPNARMAAAGLLGRVSAVGFEDLMSQLIADPSREVRAAAVEACREVGDPALLPALLEALSDPELRPAATRALSRMPESAVARLSPLLDDAERALSERCAVAAVLGRIGGAEAARALCDRIGEGRELPLRLSCASALRALRARGALATLPAPDSYEEELTRVCGALSLLERAASEIGERDPFVTSILHDHARMHIALLCALLALRHDPRTIDRIELNVCSEARELGAQALELVDEVLPRRLAPRVVAALQIWLDRGQPKGSGLQADTQRRLQNDEPWIRVATIHHVNQGAAYPTIEAGALSDADRELYRLLDVVSFLKRVPLLHELSAFDLVEQAELAQWRACREGETLFLEGDHGDALFIVCQGEVEIRVGDRRVATLGPGECLGELSLLDGERRSASAIAASEATLLEVAADRFKHLLVNRPATARALLRTLDRRIRDTQSSGQASPSEENQRMRRSQMMRAQKLGLAQLVSTISFLKQVELFRDLPTPALANLAGIAQEVIVYSGDTLFEEGDIGESLYLVCSGQIAISSGERQLAVLERNACLGEMALVSGLPRSATAMALNEGRLLRIGSDDFASLLETEPEIALSLLRTLAGRLRGALERAQRA